MKRRPADEIAAMLTAASVERHRVARFIDRQAEIHDTLAQEVVGDDGAKWHNEMAGQLRDMADQIRGGIL